jgi:hypothetical protein
MQALSASRTVRPWRVIAEEASREFDPERMIALIRELNQALEEQGILDQPEAAAEKKTA